MAGVFGVTPLQSYPSWAQGLEQGTGALANAMYQRRMLDLERQKFGLQQAEAGYVPAHTEYQPKPGTLSAPSMTQVGNVPIPSNPNATQMGAQGQIFRGMQGQTVTDQLPGSTPVNVPGHYDLTKSLAYQTSLARIMEMQQKGLAAAQVAADSRVKVAGMNDATRTGISNNINGYIGPDGQVHYGMRTLGAEAVSGYNNGQWVTDPQTGDRTFIPGVATEGKIVAGQPMVDVRQADIAARRQIAANALAERNRHNLANEGNAARSKAPIVQAPPGFRSATPTDVTKITSGVRAIQYANPTANPDSARAASTHALNDIYASQGADTLLNPLPRAGVPADTTSSGLGAMIERALGGVKRAVSGSSTAPTVPRSGTEASGLRPNAIHGANVPTTPLGNRAVPDTTTGTYPKAGNLPKSPGDPTVSVGGAGAGAAERASYNAAVARIVKNVTDPAEQARQLAQAAAIFKSRIAGQKTPQ